MISLIICTLSSRRGQRETQSVPQTNLFTKALVAVHYEILVSPRQPCGNYLARIMENNIHLIM